MLRDIYFRFILGLLFVLVFGLIVYAEDDSEYIYITEEEVSEIMAKPTVDEILKEKEERGLIKRVVHDPITGKDNYDEVVEKGYTIVFVYADKQGEESSEYEKSIALVIDKLIYKYRWEVKFGLFNSTSKAPDGYTGGKRIKKEEITDYPSLVFYKNRKKIDIKPGGVNNNYKAIQKELNLTDFWIDDILEGGHWRFENTFDIHKVD